MDVAEGTNRAQTMKGVLAAIVANERSSMDRPRIHAMEEHKIDVVDAKNLEITLNVCRGVVVVVEVVVVCGCCGACRGFRLPTA